MMSESDSPAGQINEKITDQSDQKPPGQSIDDQKPSGGDRSSSCEKICSVSNGGDSTASTEDMDLAAVYVSDAQYNRNIFFDTSPESVRLYIWYNHWLLQVLLYSFILLDLSLALFEDPALIPLPMWATMLIECVCVGVFSLRLGHYAKVVHRDKFWKDPKNIFIIVIITLTLVDMVIYAGLQTSGHPGAVRWSRVLRPLLLVNVTEGRQLRRAFRSIRNALPQMATVFLLFIFSVLIFSLMALKLFGKRGLTTVDGSPYFTNYLNIAFQLYVLVTTANSPDVMMPAYNHSSFFAVFFILYILINTYIFMSIFLAVVYNNYKKNLKEEVRQLVRAKRHKMVRAFAVLQEGAEPGVSHASWNQLVCRVQPDISSAHRQLLWSVSDPERTGRTGKLAFVALADLLNIQVITMKSRPHPLHTRCPALYEATPSRLLRRIVRHRGFAILYDVIILINAVFIGLDEENPVVGVSEWVFLSLYLLEIVLKLYTFEPRAFYARHNFWNWFDTLIVVSALIATTANAAMKHAGGGYSEREILDIIFILRVLRLVRVVDNVKRFRMIINTLIKIGPTILTFGQLILVVYYIFSMVGMELFKGKVRYVSDSSDPTASYCGNVLLEGSSFSKLKYCKNNFNNVVSSFILLLELTVVNQWHVLTSGFTAVTHPAAVLFFILFHIIVVIIIINIFIAFVLEVFFVEYTLEKSDLQTTLEKKIEELQLGVDQEKLEGTLVDSMETETDVVVDQSESTNKSSLRFKIASQRYRTVDALLQRMFEADLRPDDFDLEDDQSTLNFSNPVFSSL